MFRRLFIGLIILSTLAAEGIINIPENVYDFFTCFQMGAATNPKLVQEEKPVDFKETATLSNQAFLLTLNSLQKIKSNVYLSGQVKNENIHKEDQYAGPRNNVELYALYSKPVLNQYGKSVLYHSDSSPPTL